MPRLTEDELEAVMKTAREARVQKARALAAKIRTRGYIVDDDIRQVSLLRGQFTPFINALLKAPVEIVLVSAARKPPLRLAALSACGVSAITTLVVMTGAVLGRLV